MPSVTIEPVTLLRASCRMRMHDTTTWQRNITKDQREMNKRWYYIRILIVGTSYDAHWCAASTRHSAFGYNQATRMLEISSKTCPVNWLLSKTSVFAWLLPDKKIGLRNKKRRNSKTKKKWNEKTRRKFTIGTVKWSWSVMLRKFSQVNTILMGRPNCLKVIAELHTLSI